MRSCVLRVVVMGVAMLAAEGAAQVLQPAASAAGPAPGSLHTGAAFYVPATPETIRWGYVPAADARPVVSVPSGAVVTFDTVSHEGLLEDQGRDPERFFGGFGVPASGVLRDAEAIARSGLTHDFLKDAPHVVLGPVDVAGAAPGDVLKVEFLQFVPRVPYGVISNRHGKGALPGEFPEGAEAEAGASAISPGMYHNRSSFVPLKTVGGRIFCEMKMGDGGRIEFPATPFLGTVGVAPSAAGMTSSIAPADFGGNLDIHDLVAGSTLYLPVQVAGAKFFVADPHLAQGNGEVALTAVEGSLRATVRLTVLKAGSAGLPIRRPMRMPFAETPEFWIPIGLDPDLNEAMKKAVRSAIDFLEEREGMDRATAMAYLSAATDFQISQVVDRTKGVHALIRKSDFHPAGSK